LQSSIEFASSIKLESEPDQGKLTSMLGFKTFYNARRVLIGIELMQKIVKGQFRIPAHFGQNTGSIWQLVLAS
jgi:hypothetical protein